MCSAATGLSSFQFAEPDFIESKSCHDIFRIQLDSSEIDEIVPHLHRSVQHRFHRFLLLALQATGYTIKVADPTFGQWRMAHTQLTVAGCSNGPSLTDIASVRSKPRRSHGDR